MTECTNNAIKPSCFVFSSENPKLANCDVFLFTFLSCFTEKIPMVTTTKRVYSRSLTYHIRKKSIYVFSALGSISINSPKLKELRFYFHLTSKFFFHLTGFLPMIKKVDAYLPIFIRVLYIKHTIWLLKYILYI